MRQYIQLIGSTAALPSGAADTAPTPWLLMPPVSWPGRKGTRSSTTHTGPTPGPPPPCGMQKVLCRFKWLTSPPNSPGAATPTSAFMLAPSTYTRPPCSCTSLHSSLTCISNTPCVDGYVIITQASLSLCCSHLARRSSRSTLPLSSHAVTTTCMPAICALAGLVPCAEDGIRQTLRCVSPRLSCHALIASRPAYSPCDPAFGCRLMPA